jgi:hypothetical protein
MPTPAPALGSECTRTEEWIALLGRRDAPTDGVEDYCTFLAAALAQQGVEMKIVRVPWAEEGWFRALRHLWRESAGWRDHWVLLQYTAMGWSRRGFPLGVLAALTVLRWRGVRTAVIFHDPFRQGGQRWIHHLRGVFQDWIVRRLYGGATKAIFADPLETLRWLPKNDSKSVFIPIGANIPEQHRELSSAHNGNAKTVAIFCLSDPPNRERELAEIAHAVRYAAKSGLNARVVFMGRGTPEASEDILRAFHTVPVEVTNLGQTNSAESFRNRTRCCAFGARYIRAVEARSRQSPAACRLLLTPEQQRVRRLPKLAWNWCLTLIAKLSASRLLVSWRTTTPGANSTRRASWLIAGISPGTSSLRRCTNR